MSIYMFVIKPFWHIYFLCFTGIAHFSHEGSRTTLKWTGQYISILQTKCNNTSMKNLIKHVKSVKLLNVELLNQFIIKR